MKIKSAIRALILIASTAPCAAAVLITGQEVGNDVIFTYKGFINTTELSYEGEGIANTDIEPLDNDISAGGNCDFWGISNLRVSGSMGTGTGATGSAAGDVFGVMTGYPSLWLPKGYTSGDSISGTLTFSGHTFATLGVTENNTVSYTWGAGENTDSITFSTVPHEKKSQLTIETAVLLRFDSKIGSTYSIEESTDLENWDPIIIDVEGDGTTKKYFFEISNPRKFYRLQQPPN